MTRIDNEKFGDLIRRLRKEKHMTQKELVFLLFRCGLPWEQLKELMKITAMMLLFGVWLCFLPITIKTKSTILPRDPSAFICPAYPSATETGSISAASCGFSFWLSWFSTPWPAAFSFFRRRGSLGSLEPHPPHRRPGRYGGGRLCRGKKTQITERRHGSPDGSHPAMSPFLSGLCFFTGSAQSQWLRACTGGIQSHPAAHLPRRCIRTPCRQSLSCPRSWVWALRWSDSRCRSWCLYRS